MYNSLYIHVPFCEGRKCAYCAFYSVTAHDEPMRGSYLRRLEEEFAQYAPQCAPLRSIFVGGGTPGLLSAAELQTLGEAVRRQFALLPDCEWTIEANPESLSCDKLQTLSRCGVNRLSLGVQSFNGRLRQAIGRRGTLDNLPRLADFAHRCGMRLNFDLIYAIPGQLPEDWRRDLETALSLQPDHLSCYSLMIEEGTALWRRHLRTADDGSFLQLWELCDEVLARHGLPRYEISNFSRTGCRCRHNCEIWHGQSYLGCGPAAASFDGTDRRINPPSLSSWLRRHPPEIDRIAPDRRRREIFAFAFRTVDGWSWGQLRDVCGITELQLRHDGAVATLSSQGLLTMDHAGIRPTARGLLYNDDLLEQLI